MSISRAHTHSTEVNIYFNKLYQLRAMVIQFSYIIYKLTIMVRQGSLYSHGQISIHITCRDNCEFSLLLITWIPIWPYAFRINSSKCLSTCPAKTSHHYSPRHLDTLLSWGIPWSYTKTCPGIDTFCYIFQHIISSKDASCSLNTTNLWSPSRIVCLDRWLLILKTGTIIKVLWC